MSVHEQFADDLALYALGALSGDECLALEKHLEECPSCRREMEQLRGDSALLALSVSGPRPPARSRQRLMSAIAKEPRRAQVAQGRRAWLRALEFVAVAATLMIVAFLLRQQTELRQRVADLESHSTKQQQELVEAKQLLATLTSADAVHFTLVAGKVPPQPQGKAIYVRGSGTLVFLANNMAALPLEKIYELWLIPTTGAPIPAGLFRPDAHGSAAVIKPPLVAGTAAKTFAITIEPATCSATPPSTPIMVGIGES